MPDARLIERDDFPFEFLSELALRESWRKEVHRPIYHVHKWWAKRLGSVFRGILLGAALPADADLRSEFYRQQSCGNLVVFDPFMGSGVTIGEAHKLGMTALGRDINSVAVGAVATAFGPLDRQKLCAAVDELSATVGSRICALYRSKDAQGRQCDVLYHFWVMQATCPACDKHVDLFPSYIVARNAYPDRKPQVQILCSSCGHIFAGNNQNREVRCPQCRHEFDVQHGPAKGARAACGRCRCKFTVIDAIRGQQRPTFRLFGKLVLTLEGKKQYLAATPDDHNLYQDCSRQLAVEIAARRIRLPELLLAPGYNTRQALNYGFAGWRDFFNDRQLLALGWLQAAIGTLPDVDVRRALSTLFSGVLEFNNLFASYKGEGTGAVRHMFSHHILKPERVPIEAHVWGTPKSSGAFTTLFRSRLLRAIDYREAPSEILGQAGPGRVCAPPFTGRVEHHWPTRGRFAPKSIYLSCGNSAATQLPAESVDLVVTDPPFFDNVHYSELADFFYAWQQLNAPLPATKLQSTRHAAEVQDTDAGRFSDKLQQVFGECHRILNRAGLLIFTYHHSRDEGWRSLAEAVRGAGFIVENVHPVRAEMSGATPKSQAKEPIQLDAIVVCRKQPRCAIIERPSLQTALQTAREKLQRLEQIGLDLSRNDRKTVYFAQALTTDCNFAESHSVAELVEVELNLAMSPSRSATRSTQALLFGDP